jgi:hypothetical protein
LSKGSKIYFFICNAQAKTPFNQVNRRSWEPLRQLLIK